MYIYCIEHWTIYGFIEMTIASWPGWKLNRQPLNSGPYIGL